MEASISEVLSFLALPFLMCMILAGIHCYLGIHVLMRGVIFVDLSLAQIAAFGSTLALLFGFGPKSVTSYFISLLCTFLAAAIFSRSRRLESILSQEAIIGVTYALGAAAVVLVLDQMSHGAEQIKSLLIGQVLWVGWSDIIKVALIYGAIALIHFMFRKKFLESSRGRLKENAGFWDFLFFALFGVVITSSVSIAGVLQVFAYLIVPAMVGNIWFKKVSHKLFFGWGISFILSAVGMVLSYLYDLPSGAAIVTCFALIPLVLALCLKAPKV